MKLADISIRHRLLGAFAILFIVIILISGIVIWRSAQLWSNTQELYEHPYVVSNAIRDIRSNIYNLRQVMGQMLGADTEEALTLATKQNFELERLIEGEFDLIKERYLGDVEDIENSYSSYLDSKVIRQEVIRLCRTGNFQEARQQMMVHGNQQMQNLLQNITVLEEFASNKAVEFYTGAGKAHRMSTFFLVGSLALLLFLVVAVSYLLIRSINRPLKELSAVAQRIQAGNWNEKVHPSGKDELASLGQAFNRMMEVLNLRLIGEKNQRELGNILINSKDLPELSAVLIHNLKSTLGAHVAAFYCLDKKDNLYTCTTSIGLNRDQLPVFDASMKEGGFAHSLLSGEIEKVIQKASSVNFIYKTILGEMIPDELVTLPIFFEDHIEAMVIIGKIGEISDFEMDFLKVINPVVTAAYGKLKRAEETKRLNSELNNKNAELQQQTEELQSQTEELQSQTEELSIQSEELLSLTQELQKRNNELEKLEKELRNEKANLDISIKERTFELERAKIQAEASDQLKTSFLANMSHEVRTPINAILGFSELLLEDSDDPEEREKYLKIINFSGEHLFRLISDIVDIAKIESGQLNTDIREFCPCNIAEEVYQTYGTNMDLLEKKIELKLTIPSGTDKHLLSSDYHRIKQVLHNLLNNAIKFTEKGEIEIGYTMEEDHSCVFFVRDTGVGIKEDSLEKIFGRFVQADTPAKKRNEGTGLGLAISKGIVELLKGSIWVESKEGVGSTFYCKFPTL